MKISELRKLAEARTKGEWCPDPYDLYRRIQDTGLNHNPNWDFIAAMANHIDALLDVVEAAKSLRLGFSSSLCSKDKAWIGNYQAAENLYNALAKLEAIS